MTTPIISVADVRRSYGRGQNRFDALKGVSFDIAEGESVAIVGKSGSGKSTLMHALALLDAPTSGTITLEGVDTRTLSGGRLNRTRNRTFGFVFQQFFLTANASVLDNVMLPMTISGVPRSERKRRGLAALAQLELDDKATSKAVDLSGGQKQRAVIARALVNDPRIIFADEPTGNLDTATGAVVEDILFSLNREHGITLIIVTHDEELAARCDRRLVIRDGLLVEDVRNERAPQHHPGQYQAGQQHAGQQHAGQQHAGQQHAGQDRTGHHHAGRHLAAGSEEVMSA
jgi:putative ABC transport system ATP-binding protein